MVLRAIRASIAMLRRAGRTVPERHFSAQDSVQERRHIFCDRSNIMKRHLLAAAALFVLAGSGAALAADPSGTWLTQSGDSRIKLSDCGGAVCGTLIWMKEPNDAATGKPKTDKKNSDEAKRNRPLIGVPIVLNMKPAGTGKWTGQVYNAEDGKTYSGNLTFPGGDSLQLQGCALGGMICKSQTWTKVN
jgi:uncharacterized protein (DUF2147 family)